MITSIIEILSDTEKPLASAFLKTQVLASRLGNAELEEWVKNELRGYRDSGNLPSYRLAKSNARGSFSYGMNYNHDAPLPIAIFSQKVADILIKFPIAEGIQNIEETVKGKYGDYVGKEFGEDFGGFLSQDARKNGKTIEVSYVKVQIHISEFIQTLGQIRSRLLDLMLQLEKQYPNLEENLKDNSLNTKEVNQQITHIMSQVNITSGGIGNTITTGNGNNITVNTNIPKGDITSLLKSLQELSINEEDISEISEIVKFEQPDVPNKTFGNKTNGWISKMISKTLDGTWQIGTGTAAGVLTELLKSFFGM